MCRILALSESSFEVFEKVQIRFVQKRIQEFFNISLRSEKQVFLIFRSQKKPKFFSQILLILILALF